MGMDLKNYSSNRATRFTESVIREMTRTNRSPAQVMDDATWGIFSEGWQSPHGADADHLKTPADMDACLQHGYTFFTIDPGPMWRIALKPPPGNAAGDRHLRGH
jgi:hypothetical protein